MLEGSIWASGEPLPLPPLHRPPLPHNHSGLRPSDDKDLSGRLFVTSGLGGMSGAQPKAADIAGAGKSCEVFKPSIVSAFFHCELG